MLKYQHVKYKLQQFRLKVQNQSDIVHFISFTLNNTDLSVYFQDYLKNNFINVRNFETKKTK